jgi:hypothetical protein
LFSIDENIAKGKKGAINQILIERVEQLARECPGEALKIHEKSCFSICNGSGKEQQ